MRTLESLLLDPPQVNLESLLQTLTQSRAFDMPFSPQRIDFCAALSQQLFTLRGFADITALAYWLRRSHLETLRDRFHRRSDSLSAPRGLVFHVAPANVDTMAIYSWVLSFLSGNANIVRVSSRSSEVLPLIFRCMRDLLATESFETLQASSAFVRYGHDEEITARISSVSDLRMIWGGDATVSTIRALPAKLQTLDLSFRNRVSLAAIESAFYLGLSESHKRKVSDQFFNDLFLFDQRGCSSPRSVFWVGSRDDNQKARSLFFDHLKDSIDKKHFSFPLSQRLDRLTAIFYEASRDSDSLKKRRYHHCSSTLATIEMASLEDKVLEHPGQGLLCEYQIDSLLDMVPWIDDRIQTLSYCGFGPEIFERLVITLKGRGVDRIVPIGSALDFSALWDTYDLFDYLVKRIDVPRRLSGLVKTRGEINALPPHWI